MDEISDARDRVRLVLSGEVSPSGLPPILKTSRSDSADPSSASFANQSMVIKGQASYLGIRSDCLNGMKAGSPPCDILRVPLCGFSASDSSRRSNAVILTLLFDSSNKFVNVDPQFHAITALVDDSLPLLLGQVACDALNFRVIADDPIPLTALALFLKTTPTVVDKFDLYGLAVHPCKMRRFPVQARAGLIKTLDRPYRSIEGLRATIEVAIGFFALLGVPDDGGRSLVPPMSSRSVWNLLISAHENYFAFDPAKISAATERCILGSVEAFFKQGFNPCRDGKNASAVPWTFLVPSSSVLMGGLDILISKIHDKAGRDISDEVSLDCIPGAANVLLGASSSTVVTTSDTTLAPFQTGKHDGAEVGVDNAVVAKKTRTDAVQSIFLANRS